MVEQVKKRNGEIVIFDAKKIREAIHKANIAVADEKIPAKSLRELTDKVVGSLPAGQVPTVEQIQDKVEEILIRARTTRKPPRLTSSTAPNMLKSARARRT